MKSKMVRKLTALFVAGTMMAAMGTTAMAGTTAPESLIIKKQLTKDADTYTPDATYTFAVSPAAGNGTNIYEGIAGGVTEIVSIKTENANSGIGSTTVDIGTGTITVDADVFDHPGIYHYTVSENDSNYEGVTKDNSTKDLYVYIVSDEEGNLSFDGCSFGLDGGEGKDTGVFTNDYAAGASDLIVKKVVTGNQGDRSKEFSFTVTVTDEDQTGEQYYITFSDGTKAETITSTGSATFTLSNNETATIHGLSKNDTYTVVENDKDKDGYTTTVDGKESGTISADTTVTYTNHKEATTPTGIVTDIAPYVIMVAAAVVLGFAFLRKRSYNK